MTLAKGFTLSFCVRHCTNLQTRTSPCTHNKLSCSSRACTIDYLNDLRQEVLPSHQKWQLLTTERNLSSLSVMDQLIWKSRSPLFVCVCAWACACVSIQPSNLSSETLIMQWWILLRSDRDDYLSRPRFLLRHLQFAAVIYGLHSESTGTCLLVNNTHVKRSLHTVRKAPDFTFPKLFLDRRSELYKERP